MTTGEKLAVTLYRDKYADKALPIYAIILFVFATMCNSYSFQIKKKKKKETKKEESSLSCSSSNRTSFCIFFFHRSSSLSSSLFSSVIPLFHRPSDTRFRIQEEKKKKSNNFANSKWTFDLRNRR